MQLNSKQNTEIENEFVAALRGVWVAAEPNASTLDHHPMKLCAKATFYRAMHFSAKRGIAIACRQSVCLSVCPSVRPSVTLVNCDHIGWNSSKIISSLVSLVSSLFATPTWRSAPRGTPLNLGQKWPTPLLIWASETLKSSQIAAEWLQIVQRSQWRAYRKTPSLFRMVPSLTPYDLPFPPKWGFHMPQKYANGHISATGDPIHFMFGSRVGFSGTADLMALFSIRINSRSWIISNGHISATAHDLLI